MDLPQRDIRFTTTDDGVPIAFWEIGSGLPLIITHNWSISHAELEWTIPSIASFHLALSERYRVIRFDPRGFGMSDTAFFERGVSASGAQLGLSTEEAALDVSAVAEACEIERFALMGVMSQGPVAVEFAAGHPEKLIGLILCDSIATVENSFLEVSIRSQAALHTVQKEVGSRWVPSVFDQVAPPDELEAWTAVDMSNHQPDKPVEACINAMREWDTSSLLETVETPTLILTSRNPGWDFLQDARKLAAGIPNSQLRVVDGIFAPYVAHRAAVLDAIADLLDNEERPDVDRTPSGFRTVAFTDIVGSTEFVSRVGDEQGRAAIRDLEAKVADLAAAHAGRIVKNLGDGSLVSFGSNTSALTFAVELQTSIEDGPLQLRVGMAAGEPIQEDGDIHGAVVVQASRIADLAQAGEVVVSEGVHQLAVGKGFEFEAAGEVTLKGFDQPTTVWKVTR